MQIVPLRAVGTRLRLDGDQLASSRDARLDDVLGQLRVGVEEGGDRLDMGLLADRALELREPGDVLLEAVEVGLRDLEAGLGEAVAGFTGAARGCLEVGNCWVGWRSHVHALLVMARIGVTACRLARYWQICKQG